MYAHLVTGSPPIPLAQSHHSQLLQVWLIGMIEYLDSSNLVLGSLNVGSIPSNADLVGAKRA